MGFDDVIGQKEVKERLLQMASEGRMPHALMFCGPAGCGKMAMAMGLATHMLIESVPEGPLRNNARAMLKIYEHPDLIFSYPTIKLKSMGSEYKPVSEDFAKEWHGMIKAMGPYFTIENWMEAIGAENQQAIITVGESNELIRKLSLKSSQGGYKVNLIWLPERMNNDCANKMLKLLEEPPQKTLFLLVSENPDLLLETIRSRVQRIDMPPIAESDIQQALQSQRGLEPDIARRIAHVSQGSWNKAINMLDENSETREFLELFIELMRMAYTKNLMALKTWTDNVSKFGREKQKRMLDYFLHMVRENFAYNFRINDLVYMTQEEENFSKNFARFINENNIMYISQLLANAKRDIGQNANAKIVFFDIAAQMVILIKK